VGSKVGTKAAAVWLRMGSLSFEGKTASKTEVVVATASEAVHIAEEEVTAREFANKWVVP